MNTILNQIGLTKNEVDVYLMFLKHTKKTAAEIARLLTMDKSSCYRAVDTLVTKGLLLASPKKRGTTHTAVSPTVLKELYHQKTNELKSKESELDHFITQLLKQDESKSRSCKK
ncbi:MAG: helix-turn-helix domain-containing protein, partial [Candidatus Roizmanbacteria bacterium]|nr:helix-turn-helix domain-containing protein [Candidatus Roizmanbacteria bacterium]